MMSQIKVIYKQREGKNIVIMIWNVMKHRFLPSVGWLVSSFLLMLAGWLSGAGIGYMCEAMGWVEYPDTMFSGLAFLLFPFVGGIIGLTIMHIVRVRSWIKLHHRYMEDHKGWTRKHTIGLVIIDEIAWLMAFCTICLLFWMIM